MLTLTWSSRAASVTQNADADEVYGECVGCMRSLHATGVRDLVAETDPFFSFHHVNAFEAPGGQVVIDTCAMLGGISFDIGFEGASERYYMQPAGRSTLTRLVVDTATRQARPMHVTCTLEERPMCGRVLACDNQLSESRPSCGWAGLKSACDARL